MKKICLFLSVFILILISVFATDLSISTNPKKVALWPQTNDLSQMDLLTRIAAGTATMATNSSSGGGTNWVKATLYDSGGNELTSQSGISITNWTPTSCVITSIPPANTVTNLTSGVAGNTNIVILPGVISGALVTSITFNCNTNTPYSFDLLFCSSPLNWPSMSTTNNSQPSPDTTWGTNILYTITFTTYSTNAYGSRAIITVPVNMNLPGTFYTYKKYNSAITNSGNGATNLFTYNYQAPNK